MNTNWQPTPGRIVTEISMLWNGGVITDLREAADTVAEHHEISVGQLELLLEEYFGVTN